MPAPDQICQLVERFNQHREAYLSGQYNETQLRREFLDPFFEALGWDVYNRQGYAEAYKDVIHEDAIRIGGETKAPDYCFRIGGTRKFFVEAKKPSVNLSDDPRPAFQLRRYAWSAKLLLSILTNFNEFAVYDCRIRPDKSDKTSTARVLYLPCNEYLDHWDEIASIFSREAILKGSFDEYAESGRRKKGTAQVDDAFLGEIEQWRDELARHIALRNPHLSQRQINFAVQRTIDRLIFLRICEARGIEEYGQLMALLNGTDVYRRLCEIFYRADHRYNSGLFHFQPEKDRAEPPDELTLSLAVDDKPLKDIVRSLYYPDSPYEFSVLPADILGQVYEQFLGKVIRLTAGHRAIVEPKPEVRKAGGVYYTPTYIVDYIVRNTVAKMLEGKTPKDFSVVGSPRASPLRILDPACGSGSFLLGAYQYLLDWYRDGYVADDPKKWAAGRSPRLFQAARGEWRLTTVEQKRILLEHIYGVDIDPQAVEVTKLSLLLKVLEGENEETLNRQLRLFGERALPDLGRNIKCGNSLIGPDFYHNHQGDFFDAEERYRINAFDWEKEFPEALQPKGTKDAKKAVGFDVVIGNPPYGADFTPEMKMSLSSRYATYLWRGESYLLFVEKAHRLLRERGRFGFIVPDTYLNLNFTKPLRDYLLRESRIIEIVVLPSRVFQAASVDTTLLITEKLSPSPTYHSTQVRVRAFDKKHAIEKIDQPKRDFTVSTRHWYQSGFFQVHSNPAEVRILKKVDAAGEPLDKLADIFYGIKAYQVGKGNPPQSREVCERKPFTFDRRSSRDLLPFYDGKHVGRYHLLWRRNNWIRYGPWLAEPRNPPKFHGEKILTRKIMGKTLIATYVPETSYCNTLLYVVRMHTSSNRDAKYTLGILNSLFVGWYVRRKLQISDEDMFPQVLLKDLSAIPIPLAIKARHDRMVALVERMLALRKELPAAKTDHDKTVIQRQIDATDRDIDRLVYDLYGLTEEEIAIIE